MLKDVIFFIGLLIFSAYLSQTIDAQTEYLPSSEILGLKGEAQKLKEKLEAQKKAQSKTFYQAEYLVKGLEQDLAEVAQDIQRLSEVDDMPLSRPEADAIKSRVNKIQQRVLSR